MAPRGDCRCSRVRPLPRHGWSVEICDRVHPNQCTRGRAADARTNFFARHHRGWSMVHVAAEQTHSRRRGMTATIRRGLIIAVALYGTSAAGITAGQVPRRPPSMSLTTTLGVPGAVNGTPSLTIAGRTVAAVWTATQDGATNVYLAMSNDGGATFSEPRRVNDQHGDASANNEQPPRVTVSGSGATRMITVVWSKRNEGPQKTRRDALRMSRSTDGGRTFSPARHTHDAALSGARGWESLAVGANGQVHAVWLDGRDAERKMAAAAHSGAAHKGQPPQD